MSVSYGFAERKPEPPKGFKGAKSLYKKVLSMAPKSLRRARSGCEDDDVDLTQLPIQYCWPGDAAPLITGLTIPRSHKERQNLIIYRQQVLGEKAHHVGCPMAVP